MHASCEIKQGNGQRLVPGTHGVVQQRVCVSERDMNRDGKHIDLLSPSSHRLHLDRRLAAGSLYVSGKRDPACALLSKAQAS